MRTPRPSGVGMLCLLAAAAAWPARVEVDATTHVVIGEQRQVSSSLFGLTAFEGFPSATADLDYRARLLAIRPGAVRLAGNLRWCSPKEFDLAWYDTPAAATAFNQTLLFGARYPTGRFLPILRQIGAEPMCSLGGAPEWLQQEGTRHPSDFDKWAQMCAAYIGLWKRADPQLRLVQIWNEPNSTWFRDPRHKPRGITSAELHIEMANKVARAIKARYPGLQIGGPVLCWPPSWPPNQKGHNPWYTWASWTVPWLEKTKHTIDFFDFHSYNVDPDDFAVQVEMVANQARITQGRRLPIWITESNYRVPKEERSDPAMVWRKRMLLYERYLLRGVLPQADKVEGNMWHDLHARHFTLLPGSADKPDPSYWLLWVLRDLRGLRVAAESQDADVVTYATMEDDRVTVVLFNDSPEAKPVDVSVTMPCSYWTGPRIRAIGESPAGACERLSMAATFERKRGHASGRLELPPRGTLSVNFRMNVFGKPQREHRTVEHFGDRTLTFIKTDEPARLTIALPNAAAAQGKAWLRLGLLGTEGDEPLLCRLNREQIDVRATALQDVLLDARALRQRNALEVCLSKPVDNPRLALGFAAVVVRTPQ